MATSKFSETLSLGDVDFTFSGSWYPGYEGSMYRSNGDPGDPPEPAEVSYDKVTACGVDFTNFFALIEDEAFHRQVEALLLEKLETPDNEPEPPDDYEPL